MDPLVSRGRRLDGDDGVNVRKLVSYRHRLDELTAAEVSFGPWRRAASLRVPSELSSMHIHSQ